MEYEYAIEAFGKRFAVVFIWAAYSFNHFEKITSCSIIELPENKIYSGATIKNPHDITDDFQIARRWAYKRAVLNLWLIWTELKQTSYPFVVVWQQFRKALAANELYLKDRREK